ncbi:transcription initiation factor IIB [Natrinema sp. CBA1119]|uniref:transcription initiation factor IIB n=1 Tax=Natrinema sp. CBA1119 TaxID=1608465 RepID=UPI000BF94B10|nr:transcription initiation factor IIB family protein [Natrinema sp. CBA1119]PGF14651.1 transcription initiation factor IIB [Natrinema sp. CBA1119]
MTERTDTNSQSQTELLERITAIQTDLGIDETTREYAMSIVAEIPSREIWIRSPTRTAAAALLMACRLREIPVRVTVLAEQTSVTKANILDEMQRLSNELEIAIPLEDPTTILEETCGELAIPESVENRAIRLAELGDSAGVTSGVSPYTFAAAVLYIVCTASDVDLSQAEIASHLDVSTATLRDRRDDLLEATGGQLFERRFPEASSDAIALVDSLLRDARDANWAANKRFLGLVAGAWLYTARQYDLETSVADFASLTGISESTIQARYDQYDAHRNPSRTPQGKCDP